MWKPDDGSRDTRGNSGCLDWFIRTFASKIPMLSRNSEGKVDGEVVAVRTKVNRTDRF